MKGSPMKEKVIFTLSLACFIGIMWLSSTTKSTNVKPIISEVLTITPEESNTMKSIDDVLLETIYVDNAALESDVTAIESCSLNPVDTDVFTFGDAFQYYRQCLGSDSSFHWKGSTYTTLLSEEVSIQVADSVHVKEETAKNNEVSETR